MAKESGKASCQRLMAVKGAWPETGEVKSDIGNRCSVMMMPPNPVRSAVYLGVLSRNQKSSIDIWWSKYSMDTLLNELSLTADEKAKVVEMVRILAYNKGPETAVLNLKNWLDYRIKDKVKVPLKKEELVVWAAFDNRTVFRTIPEEVQLSAKETKGKSKAQVRLLREKAITKARLEYMKKNKLEITDWANYMAVFGEAAYLKSVKAAGMSLDTNMGKGVCTQDKFLEL